MTNDKDLTQDVDGYTCTDCGSAVSEDDKVCPKCGVNFSIIEEPKKSTMVISHIFFSFKGRIPRSVFWFASIGSTALYLISGFFIISVGSPIAQSKNGYLLESIPSILFFWSSLSIIVKRWHDLNKSGWWIFILIIPIIGALWYLVECGFTRGTNGTNKYGEDPLETEIKN